MKKPRKNKPRKESSATRTMKRKAKIAHIALNRKQAAKRKERALLFVACHKELMDELSKEIDLDKLRLQQVCEEVETANFFGDISSQPANELTGFKLKLG